MMRRMRWVSLFTVLVLPVVVPPAAEAQESTVVYLVRHAERATDDPRDPNLSEPGRGRAGLLATMLRDAGIEAIYSTDYRRTQQTAGPVAETLGVEVTSYDPRGAAFADFARALRADGRRALVVGHSNTTPALVELLGGDPGSPIDEDEYDRLYVVMLGPDGATTTLLRFGAASH